MSSWVFLNELKGLGFGEHFGEMGSRQGTNINYQLDFVILTSKVVFPLCIVKMEYCVLKV